MTKQTYSEKLRDPRWQKKRLEIMQRDDFTCKSCGDKSTTLNVHHLYYASGLNPWDYTSESLTTLCEKCHSDAHNPKVYPAKESRPKPAFNSTERWFIVMTLGAWEASEVFQEFLSWQWFESSELAEFTRFGMPCMGDLEGFCGSKRAEMFPNLNKLIWRLIDERDSGKLMADLVRVGKMKDMRNTAKYVSEALRNAFLVRCIQRIHEQFVVSAITDELFLQYEDTLGKARAAKKSPLKPSDKTDLSIEAFTLSPAATQRGL